MSTTRHTDTVEVILKDQRRRRWSPAEKAALVRRTYEPGMSVSLVARQEGVAASLLFQWRKLDRHSNTPLSTPGGRPDMSGTARPIWIKQDKSAAYTGRLNHPSETHVRNQRNFNSLGRGQGALCKSA